MSTNNEMTTLTIETITSCVGLPRIEEVHASFGCIDLFAEEGVGWWEPTLEDLEEMVEGLVALHDAWGVEYDPCLMGALIGCEYMRKVGSSRQLPPSDQLGWRLWLKLYPEYDFRPPKIPPYWSFLFLTLQGVERGVNV